MSLRHSTVTSAALSFAFVACASPQELSDDLASPFGIDAGSRTRVPAGGHSAGGGAATNASPTVSSGGDTKTAPHGDASALGSTGGASSRSVSPGAGGDPSSMVPRAGGLAGANRRFDAGPPNDAAIAPCPAGEKRCPGDPTCYAPTPWIGCNLGPACAPCPPSPEHGVLTCSNGACDFECVSGFHRGASGTDCEAGDGTGGASGRVSGSAGSSMGGTGGNGAPSGSGGSPGLCDPNRCPPCRSLLEAPCCRLDVLCGCAVLGVVCR